jgi:hypothetical protein
VETTGGKPEVFECRLSLASLLCCLLTDRLISKLRRMVLLTRWKKDETEFSVKLTDDGKDSIICRVPKPILDRLESPSSIKFVIFGKKIIVEAGKK